MTPPALTCSSRRLAGSRSAARTAACPRALVGATSAWSACCDRYNTCGDCGACSRQTSLAAVEARRLTADELKSKIVRKKFHVKPRLNLTWREHSVERLRWQIGVSGSRRCGGDRWKIWVNVLRLRVEWRNRLVMSIAVDRRLRAIN